MNQTWFIGVLYNVGSQHGLALLYTKEIIIMAVTTHYTIWYNGGTHHILAYSEVDAMERFKKLFKDKYRIIKVEKGLH